MTRRSLPILLFFVVILFAVSGCSLRDWLGVSASGDFIVGGQSFAVLGTNPSSEEIGTFVFDPLSVTFAGDVDPATINSSSFVVTDAGGSVVTGTLSAGETATFTPDANLRFGMAYTATITTEVTDSAGAHLESDYTWTFVTMPVPVSGGGWHALAVADDNTVSAWGWNGWGVIGDGTYTDNPGPVPVLGPDGTGSLSDIIAVAAGNDHSMALKNDGTVWTWGSNGSGQLGNPTYAVDSTLPVQVVGLGGAGFLTGVVSIAAEYYQSFALRNDGTVVAWGYNVDDQLGDGTGANSAFPIQVFTDAAAISSGSFHTLALKNDGTVWAWGEDSYGELGDGIEGGSNVFPTQVVGPGGAGFLTDIISIDAGEFVSSVVKSDGTVWTWGGNYTGQLGDGGSANMPWPVQVVGVGGTGFLTDIVQVDAAYDHIVAFSSTGSAYGWGSHYFASLGNGAPETTTESNTPVQVVGEGGVGMLSGVIGVATTDYYTSFAVLSDGLVMGWGWNDKSELVATTVEIFHTRVSSSTPVQVGLLDLIP
ncbi:MAG: hypothetical protein HN368_14795 [Spirochaetales bacterium]|jgi:alpha-tubulin suppressor-like RCC1 family protein|nr:hypothetical protein [Spirochaetales bacterium]